MKREIDLDTVANPVDDLLPWRKPEIRRLTVLFDTQGFGGTAIDGFEEDPGNEFPSDLRLKKDVSGITDALSHILALKGVTYRYDAAGFPQMGLSTRPQIGFVAQDLERVYPQLVKTREDGFKAVNYSHLVPVLVEAIKEQQSMIAELRERVEKLQETRH